MKKLLLFLLIGLGFMACRKDLDDVTTKDDLYTPPVIKVNGTVAGQVVDEQGNGIAGAIVHLGNLQRETNSKGFFQFRNVILDANGTFVKVDQPGYFHSSTRLFPKANSTNYITLTLMTKQTTGQVEAGTGGKVTLSSGASITLPAGGIVTSDGSLYTGTVSVAARWLDPSSPDLSRIMPGNLQGISANQEEVALVTYGMLAVELTGSAGERLNLGSGKEAELFFPLPTSMRNSAPGEIPLWYFDENTGLWREEGKATKSGNGYEGNVKHFSFWNCDVSFPTVNIEGQIVDANDNPVVSLGVGIYSAELNQTGYGYTNTEGVFGGKVPKDQLLVLKIRDYCGEVLFEENIGPFNQDINLGVFALSGVPSLSQVTGNLKNCDGTPPTNAVICISFNGWRQFYPVASDGSFSISQLYLCLDDITLFGFDFDTNFSTDVISLSPETNTDVGDIFICEQALTEYLKVNINGYEHVYPFPQFNGNPAILGTTLTQNHIYVNSPFDSTYAVGLDFPEKAVGTYSGDGVRFSFFDFNPVNLSVVCEDPCSDVTINITEFGAVGEYIRGNFNGVLDVNNDETQQILPNLPVSGEFSVLRSQ